ncbi:TonB-dependent receptor [Flavobacterium psychrotolerans]|uniref:TonB-dependent receptor n=1 Tax=Flavobacterium psychrotolerans TaxID=2169410 RepID=A0A2U1JHF6_9FLAO|nr:TonB-dependent receptor [Flavobacterium psychrotolerans]PWA04557.1 TonB-dependent receptor [Flavobacterium psychrotolerans]
MNTIFFSHNGTKTQNFKFPVLFSIIFSLLSFSVFSQVKDTIKVNALDEVLVSAVRVTTKTPVSFSNLDKQEIANRNLGQDIPILMNYMPSVVTTSDAGNGFGYTSIRVRGSDAARVNVTINGIPYNDSESQGTYFVDLPDLASSLQSIQLQRGVGTSTNGSGAFGASLNLLTDNFSKESRGEIANSFGSFNSRKHTIKFSTGLMNDHFELAGRLSDMHSDGYVDRAASNLKSYFLQGTYVGKTTLIKALVFGGTEKTYQAWYGVDATTLNQDRTFNAAGMYTDANGKIQFYNNQTDNYQQDHYQLHWNEKISKSWNTNLAFHYTKGKGYYEEFQENQAFSDYGLTQITFGATTIDHSNLITRKWLDNDFYGTTFSVNYKKDRVDFVFGGSANKYNGKHFGQIIWAQFASNSQNSDHYYDNYGNKLDLNFFSKINYQLTEKFSIYGDLQYRTVNYKADGVQSDLVNDTFRFFNPKAGLTYLLNQNQNLYFSYARANREPNRTDYENGSPRPEKLNDFELGWRFATSKTQLNINGYYMLYKDQLVLTGALDNVGNPIRTNIGESYRLGVEVDANFQVSEKWSIRPNITLSENKNKDFVVDNGAGLENLGKTNIAFSPKIVAGNSLNYSLSKELKLSFLSKFVGEQFLSNIDDQNSRLKDYFIQDFHALYEIKTNKVFKSIGFSVLANNLFNVKYVSNGADYGGGYVYYFPQAGANFLAGMTLKF